MAKVPSPSSSPPIVRPEAVVELISSDDGVALLSIVGLVDERFKGFGAVASTKTIILDVAGITRMTSFGVRQWLKAMDGLPKAVTELLLVGCPTFFVDQLNMVLNFGGSAKILTVSAPYTCPSCGVESSELIDLLTERDNLAAGGLPEKRCPRCDGVLEFDETPSSYFAFRTKYGATSISPAAAAFLGARGMYSVRSSEPDKAPKIIKLVYGSVTYFQVVGKISSTFRARPFLVGAEGEVVIDLANVDAIDATGQTEWQRLLRSLSAQVPSITLIDLKESLLPALDRSPIDVRSNVVLGSLLVPYVCLSCNRRTVESRSLAGRTWPPQFEAAVCSLCRGAMRHEISGSSLVRLKAANTAVPPATEAMIARRHEILGQALSEANTPMPVEVNSSATGAEDTILGKYKIVQRLDSTGLVEVFLAKQVGIGGFEKPIVLKRISRGQLGDQAALGQLLAEINRAARLAHPNIVQVLDVGEMDDMLYLATEYVAGQTLKDVLERLHSVGGTIGVPEACQIARDIALAVEHAYSAADLDGQPLAVVHGDLSPHNIVIRTDGTVKVSDFGVAIAASRDADLQFMAPELLANESISHRSDLFSLGMLIYAMCSASTPFPNLGAKDLLKKLRTNKIPPLGGASIPPALSALVAQLLSPKPEDRPARAGEVAAALADITRAANLVGSTQSVSWLLTEIGFNDVPAPAAPRNSASMIAHPAEANESIAAGSSPTGQRVLPRARSSSRPYVLAGLGIIAIGIAVALRFLI